MLSSEVEVVAKKRAGLEAHIGSRVTNCQKDSCNLMWTAERPRSAELKQEDLDRIQTTKQRRTLIRIIKKIAN